MLASEEVELLEEVLDLFPAERYPLHDDAAEEVLFGDVASAVEVHGGVGLLRVAEDVAYLFFDN